MDLGTLAAVATAVVLVGGALFAAWVRHGRPRARKIQSFLARIDQTINGKPAERDAYGRQTAPAIPPLAEQTAATQKQLGELTTAVQTLVEHTDEISGIKTRVSDLERRVTDVEHLHQVERITSNVAQGKVVDAIAEAHRRRSASEGSIDATVDEPDTEL